MGEIRHYVMQAQEGRATDLGELLLNLKQLLQAQAGCVEIQLLRDTSEDEVFLFIETWQTSAHQKAAGAAIGKDIFGKLMAILRKPPELRALAPL